METLLLIAAALFLAWANGANDNFKGVATLYGSGTRSFRASLNLANAATLLGSLVSAFLAPTLVSKFSGKGLVPQAVVQNVHFALAVAAAAGGTVLLATRFGFPISTTHALMGALVGAGLVLAPGGVEWSALWGGFVKPLLMSPLLAMAGALMIYVLSQRLGAALKIQKDSCLCLGRTAPVLAVENGALAQGPEESRWSVGRVEDCQAAPAGKILRIEVRAALDGLHGASAAMVSFARGLNDTPKIAALLLLAGLGSSRFSAFLIGAAMLWGGWLGTRRVAETMSHRITDMNPGQGFSANLATSAVVIGASLIGNPVSTTHVSCGALFGIGAATGRAHGNVVAGVLASWLVTLPLAATLAFVSAWSIRALG